MTDDLRKLRGLALARAQALPIGGVVPTREDMAEAERDELLQDFLDSYEAVGLTSLDHEEDAETVEDWPSSPVTVEIFCCDWAPRKIAGDGEMFSLLPDVLRAWIRFVGHRRNVPEGRVHEAVAAVDKHVHEMLDAADDPEAWGPAKAMVQAMQSRGIDYEVYATGGLASLR